MSEFAIYPSLKDKIIYITGGASGIPLAFTSALIISPIERTGIPVDARIAANSPLPAAGNPLTANTSPMI